MYGSAYTSLPCESEAWRSPQGANATQGPKSAKFLAQVEQTGQSEITLTDQAADWGKGSWARPRAANTTGAGLGRNGPRDDIQSHAENWAGLWGTPKACEGTNPSGGDREGLDAQAKNHGKGSSWTTPCADDTGTRSKPYSQGGSPLSLQADEMMTAGPKSSPAPPTSPQPSRRLNPRFEEWLMRLPIGWIGSELSETELTLWSQRWRSRLFGIGLPGAGND